MRAVVVSLSTLLGLAACGDNLEPPGDVARSGARLKLARYVYEDGTAQIETRWFHDVWRRERCTPRRWSDGHMSCTPDAAETVYTSPMCGEMLGRVPAGAAAPAYVLRHYWLDGEWHPSRLFHTGERADAPPYHFELRDGACLGPYDTSGYDYYTLGAEVDRAELARVARPELAGDARLALSVFTSADGLRAPTALRDRELDMPCVVDARAGAATTACVPVDATPVEYFHDPACTQPELAIGSGYARPARLSYRDAASSCTTYYPLGDRVDPVPLFHVVDGTCIEVAAPYNQYFYLAGPALALAPLDRLRGNGDRLKTIEVSDGALRLPDPLLHDALLGADCLRTEVGAELRCVPVTQTEVTFVFGDDGCQTPLPLAMVRTGACRPDTPFAIDTGGHAPVLRAIGAPHTAPIYHLSTGDRCLTYQVPAGRVAHDVGPPLPPQTFAAAIVVIDPS